MRPTTRMKLLFGAATSAGLLGIVGYPTIKSILTVKKEPTIVDDYFDLPTATSDLTKDIMMPEAVGAGTDVPINISHWLLLSLLKSRKEFRRERALNELAKQRRWNDAQCIEIAQALDQRDVIKLARTVDADIRMFLPPPSISFIEKTLESEKIEKFIKTILKEVSEKSDPCSSSCASFYTNLSIRVRPNSDELAMSDLNQVDKMIKIESRKRKRTLLSGDIIRLKAVLNNIICSEQQASLMANSGLLIALLYYKHKYPDNVQVNGLLSQMLANLTFYDSTRDYAFANGWIRILTDYTRSENLELSLPAFKALANLDEDNIASQGLYGNHVYLLSPLFRNVVEPNFDVIFVHGLVGSVFKSWRQGSIPLDEFGNRQNTSQTPTTELLPNLIDSEESGLSSDEKRVENGVPNRTRCWPKDWLPEDVPGLRVLALDYPTALSNWRTDCDLNKDALKERANHVMKQLEAAKVGQRPIVWVAHSMGGLLIKQILVSCDEIVNQRSSENGQSKTNGTSFEENILNQTRGIVFYSVPHKGSNLSWIERKNLQKLLQLTTEVIELQKGSTILLDLHEKFLQSMRRRENQVKFLTFAENSISSFGVNKVVQWKGVLVHEDSLHFEIGPIYKLDIDHAHTCKPHSREAITYVKTLEFIKSLLPPARKDEDEKLMPYISFML